MPKPPPFDKLRVRRWLSLPKPSPFDKLRVRRWANREVVLVWVSPAGAAVVAGAGAGVGSQGRA